ncbi:hypothetical protein KFK09_007289 [Dendrobium nobile]|uniref:Reverse transcriptase domain-containing protein n=1 Tax=Dendrobium nobile TaxID=94219 RepID=A0A8T3BRN8_DENNO|nr:hypothetical protein KFK09_007289 [Dendrobium nobile]
MLFPHEASCNNFDDANLGRIWLKWNPSSVNFQRVISSQQFIHGFVSSSTTSPFTLTAVYAANSMADRVSLWNDLASIAKGINGPWIIMGDFNCFKDSKEKQGGTSPHLSQLNELNSWLSDSGTFELSSTGLNFTWFNQRAADPIHIKLDIMLVNFDWLENYPTSFYKVDPPGSSDHSPLILCSGNNGHYAGRFLFKNYWIHMEGFWDTVIAAFSSHSIASPIANLYRKLNYLKKGLKCKKWSSANFLQDKVKLLEHNQDRCLELIQRDPLNTELNATLKEINSSLSFFQKAWTNWIVRRAKANWLANGEDDLGFLYARIKDRGNSNHIKVISTANGVFYSPTDIARETVAYFKDIFNAPTPTLIDGISFPKGSTIPQEQQSFLTAQVTDQEIKDIIFASSTATSPGPDGYTFEFYKSTWGITGYYICQAIKNFFETGILPKAVKATAIVLIPKTPHASQITDFRPISLCNTFYKIIAKILANRMKPIMPAIIHKSQAGFIQKRLATDNITLAMEILRDFKVSAGKNFFCAKLDIKKAFDCISRDFIIARMHKKEFPLKFINWIKGCIYDVPFSVCINGALHGYFNSTSGLRQGCPLSPLLFAIAMDAFSCYMDESNFCGFPCGKAHYSHLLYADDVLVFGPATGQNAQALNHVISNFGNSSGLHINRDKCSIIFSRDNQEATDIANSLQFARAENVIKYLGLPLSTKKLSISYFQPLLSKIATLLAGWKVKFLSFAGKSLADLNLQAIPNSLDVKNWICNGCWDLTSVPSDLHRVVLSIPIHDDGLAISWTGKGVPCFKTFKRKFFEGNFKVPWYKYIWHKHFAIRYSSYTWLAIKEGLKSAEILALRGILITPVCYLCQNEDESSSHLFFQCPFSFSILHSLLPDVRGFLLRPNMLQLFEHFEDCQTIEGADRKLAGAVFFTTDIEDGQPLDCPGINVLCGKKRSQTNKLAVGCRTIEEVKHN